MKKVVHGEDTYKQLLKGAQVISKVVGSTLGPKGSNVAISRDWGVPSVIHDGVSVAREVEDKDPGVNMGIQLVREAAQKTNDMAGDGTTTATILAYAISKEAIKNVMAGANAMILRKGMNKAVKKIVQTLRDISKPIKDIKEIGQVATVSAQSQDIGDIITGAIEKLGHDAVIAVEESAGTDIMVDYKEGMQFDKGFASPHFITKPDTNEAEISDPYIFLTDYKFDDVQRLVDLFKNFGSLEKQGTNLVIIADSFSPAILAHILSNKLQGRLNVIPIQCPYYGEKRADFLADLAVVTGGSFISSEAGDSIKDMTIEDYGRAQLVNSTADRTMIVGGMGDKLSIDKRVMQLKKAQSLAKKEFDQENLQERIAKLSAGIAVITVGAGSEMEMREIKERCIDAINATKSAIEEGIIFGGEIALLESSLKCDVEADNQDERLGVNIIVNACQEPFKVLMENSGFNPGQMLERVIKSASGKGVDVMDGKIKDLMSAGIIDPVKVSRCALENASSCAVMLMTTKSLIVEKKK